MQYLWNQSNVVAPQQQEEEEEADKCPICLEEIKTVNVSITACGHKFCTSCLLSSLKKDNRCPSCRREIEKTRKTIDPITMPIATDLIRQEERGIKLIRRIEVIQSFDGHHGRSSMIYSLCREFAFATAHAIAHWQSTNGAYHESWAAFDLDESDDESEETNDE
jgi:hypothetical protein